MVFESIFNFYLAWLDITFPVFIKCFKTVINLTVMSLNNFVVIIDVKYKQKETHLTITNYLHIYRKLNKFNYNNI